MKVVFHFFFVTALIIFGCSEAMGQKTIEKYQQAEPDSIQVGPSEKDYMPFIQKGYTLMLPEQGRVNGVLIFLEDSKYDQRNANAQQIYSEAIQKDFAVLSVSSEIPLDFFFSETSILDCHRKIKEVFSEFKLPNEHIFLIGSSLVGHRALKYIEYMSGQKTDFELNLLGLVLCNFTMDWTRKWHQHQRDIRLNKIDLWEPKFINFMLETHLEGTPESAPENYHNFSSYSYSDTSLQNIQHYLDYDIRVYIEPAIEHRLDQYYRTLYENNATDMVGFVAELRLAGNQDTELKILQPTSGNEMQPTSVSSWNRVDKRELMNWITSRVKQSDQ